MSANSTEIEEGEEFDPFKNRKTDRLTSDLETTFNLITLVFSSGLMAVPLTFSLIGWLAGIIMLLSMTVFYIYIINELLQLRYNVCKIRKKIILSVPEILRLGLRDGPRWLTPYSKAVGYLAFLSILINIIGNIISLLTSIAQHMHEFSYTNNTLRIWIFTCFVPLFILLIVLDTKKLTIMSIMQNIAFMCGVGMAIDYLVNNLPSLSKRKVFKEFKFYSLFLGINLKTMNAISTILVAEMHMRTPENLAGPRGVLSVAMSIWMAVMISVGFFGYWKFGDTVSNSFLSNFPNIRLTFVAKSLVCVSYFLAFPSQVEVIVEMVWFEYVKEKDKFIENKQFFQNLVRVTIGVICGVIGFGVPIAGIYFSVVGCMVTTALCCIFPAILDIHDRQKKPLFFLHLIKDILLIIIGVGLVSCVLYLLISNTLKAYGDASAREVETLRNLQHYYPRYLDF